MSEKEEDSSSNLPIYLVVFGLLGCIALIACTMCNNYVRDQERRRAAAADARRRRRSSSRAASRRRQSVKRMSLLAIAELVEAAEAR